MKKYLLFISIVIFVFGFTVSPIYAESEVTFAWDANTEPDLAGYKLHKGNSTGNYGTTINVGNVTTYTWIGIQDGTYFFAATAYDDDDNESAYSDELTLSFDTSAPSAVKNFTVTVTGAKSVTIERTESPE